MDESKRMKERRTTYEQLILVNFLEENKIMISGRCLLLNLNHHELVKTLNGVNGTQNYKKQWNSVRKPLGH